MAISDIKSAISTAVQNALGIRCFTSIPSVLTPPCAWIQTGAGNYLVTLPQANEERILEVALLFARAEALEDAQAKLDAYLLPTTTTSMKLAIQGSSISSYASYLRVVSDTGVIPIVHNDQSYIGCRWRVSVMI